MGSMYAAGLAEAVQEGYSSLEQALKIHLTGNFYPPLPSGYAAPVLKAIEACIEHDFDARIDLPSDLNPLPRVAQEDDKGVYVTAGELIRVTRTEAFLPESEDY